MNAPLLDLAKAAGNNDDSIITGGYYSEKGLQAFPKEIERLGENLGRLICSFFLDSRIFHIFENDVLNESGISEGYKFYDGLNEVSGDNFFGEIKTVSYMTLTNPELTFSSIGDASVNRKKIKVKDNILAVFQSGIFAWSDADEEKVCFIKSASFLQDHSEEFTARYDDPIIPVNFVSFSACIPKNKKNDDDIFIANINFQNGITGSLGVGKPNLNPIKNIDLFELEQLFIVTTNNNNGKTIQGGEFYGTAPDFIVTDYPSEKIIFALHKKGNVREYIGNITGNLIFNNEIYTKANNMLCFNFDNVRYANISGSSEVLIYLNQDYSAFLDNLNNAWLMLQMDYTEVSDDIDYFYDGTDITPDLSYYDMTLEFWQSNDFPVMLQTSRQNAFIASTNTPAGFIETAIDVNFTRSIERTINDVAFALRSRLFYKDFETNDILNFANSIYPYNIGIKHRELKNFPAFTRYYIRTLSVAGFSKEAFFWDNVCNAEANELNAIQQIAFVKIPDDKKLTYVNNAVFFTDIGSFSQNLLHFFAPSNIPSRLIGIYGEERSIYTIGEKGIEEFQIADVGEFPMNFVRVQTTYEQLVDWLGIGEFSLLVKNKSDYYFNGVNFVRRYLFDDYCKIRAATVIKGLRFRIIDSGSRLYLIDDSNRLYDCLESAFVFAITLNGKDNVFANILGTLSKTDVENSDFVNVEFSLRNTDNAMLNEITLHTSNYGKKLSEANDNAKEYFVYKDGLARSRKTNLLAIKFYKLGKIRNSRISVKTNGYLIGVSGDLRPIKMATG